MFINRKDKTVWHVYKQKEYNAIACFILINSDGKRIGRYCTYMKRKSETLH